MKEFCEKEGFLQSFLCLIVINVVSIDHQLCDIVLGIVLVAYSPLGSADRPARLVDPSDPAALKDPVVLQIAEKHKSTAAQVSSGMPSLSQYFLFL